MASIGQQIIAARKAKGMTQDALAKKLNISRAAVSNYEGDRRLPDAETLLRLSGALDCSFAGVNGTEDASAPAEQELDSPMEAEAEVAREDRVLYLDILRILATFFVIMLHVSSQHWYENYFSHEWNVFNAYNSISRWGVPVFVMISGSLFLSRELTTRRLYTKYIARIVTAFVTWSALYSFVYNIPGKKGFASFVADFLKGYYHMWFLFMIVGLYMIVPFLRRIVASEALTKYYLALGLVFAFLIPQLNAVLSLFSPALGAFFTNIMEKWELHFVLGFSTYFVLGFYLRSRPIGRRAMTAILLLGIAGFVSTALLSRLALQHTDEADAVFHSSNSVNVFLEALSVFVGCRALFQNRTFGKKTGAVIQALSKYSFGAYLVHVMIITILNRFVHLNTLSFDPLLSVPVISIIVFILSFAVSAVINHIPVLNKTIV